jgi:PncC family amidohydrolase
MTAGTLQRETEATAQALRASGLKVAVAESCTGGLVAAALTEIPGSSAYFLGGIVAYHDDVKRLELGVSDEALQRHGAVSAEVARTMAEEVRRRLNADLGVGVTGVAGPGAEGSKPAGLTYISVAGPAGTTDKRYQWSGDRRANREASVAAALALLRAASEHQS